jgi:hypothetical protein
MRDEGQAPTNIAVIPGPLAAPLRAEPGICSSLLPPKADSGFIADEAGDAPE